MIYANDPMLGIMHYHRDGSPAFVFDLMEAERPKAERVAFASPNRRHCDLRLHDQEGRCGERGARSAAREGHLTRVPSIL